MIDTKKLRVGDCIIFEGKGLISDGIKWFTSSKASHVAIYVGGGNAYVIEAVPDGVAKTKLEKVLKHKKHIWVRRIPDLSLEEAEIMKAEAYKFLDRPYDFLQFFSLAIYLLLRKFDIYVPFLVVNSVKDFICSEVWYKCARKIGFKLGEQPKLVTPNDLLETDLLENVIDQKI